MCRATETSATRKSPLSQADPFRCSKLRSPMRTLSSALNQQEDLSVSSMVLPAQFLESRIGTIPEQAIDRRPFQMREPK